ncbi:sugar ABC transporter ATP-binding protein [Thermus thermophilus]|uniref:Sugar ABC transporter ATP-binding protein n=1 Tax=Thermus thermophilus TaxID=274 RepID=A0AAD1KUG6_THETH|nr:ABC transporter ATP-binding protein [Thermus thermophilus]BBL82223.1 sugar ABC transporter ATP-binding protein [Thermus thermophilus]BBL84526.1 sugar ABC transporter ATP-binding protein [Thermus thermophilus]BCZ86877.1 sugar ABC transporter ATP-binding protein [Thermus thermophilus]BCZ91887.1 sugar ABC transporter ATP-binding protein [Thermus thermophilus]
MAGIRVEKVSKRFGKVEALKGVDLEVRDQEFLVLLGPSGCGKTTLLRIVAGLEAPTSGEVYIGERRVTHLPPRLRGIAMVFQNYAIFPHLTVYENVAFGLRMKRRPEEEIRRKVGEVAALLHIEELLDRYPAQLSGGQRQRVAVARALAVEPEVLLMDEPLSNLDALLRLEMRAELKRLLKETRTTTLYVTHDQVEAMSLADRIAVMRQGEIVQLGTPTEIYHAPADTFVGGFIGNPPMNFLRARAAGGKVVLEGFAVPSPVEGEVLLGVRPEDLRVSKEQAEGAFRARVLVVEPLGPHLQLTLEREGETFRALADPDFSVAFGEEVWVRPNPGRVRLFHPKTGKALA